MVIGAGNENTVHNIRELAGQGRQLLVRIPLINNFNASESYALRFAVFFKEINNEKLNVEVLKYHEYGKDKWLQCGLDYKMHDAFVTKEQFEKFIQVLKMNNIKIVST
ncbi:hypothetical protein SDC9_164904 [bioreactor metagenome]|uniref:4-hydroxyphenylacetate decarboxylase activating enzyme n=1 Tax=bioreactor metagenome TaxID=1076179 RepID=A0A645FV41_9ZZZZ